MSKKAEVLVVNKQEWEALTAEFVELKTFTKSVANHCTEVETELIEARRKLALADAQITSLREALDWYASIERPADEYSADCGERARAALAALKGK